MTLTPSFGENAEVARKRAASRPGPLMCSASKGAGCPRTLRGSRAPRLLARAGDVPPVRKPQTLDPRNNRAPGLWEAEQLASDGRAATVEDLVAKMAPGRFGIKPKTA